MNKQRVAIAALLIIGLLVLVGWSFLNEKSEQKPTDISYVRLNSLMARVLEFKIREGRFPESLHEFSTEEVRPPRGRQAYRYFIFRGGVASSSSVALMDPMPLNGVYNIVYSERDNAIVPDKNIQAELDAMLARGEERL